MITRARRSTLKQLAPKSVRSLASTTVGRLHRANLKPFSPPPLRGDQLLRLHKIFDPEMERLEGLIGRDLSGWRENGEASSVSRSSS